ncbi:hypothetical protein QEJ31_04800 [Pigmentibacter sp. JX0631]|uniref:hypothetical protein n=1 Tax=Pigmentibacter sp. JX0631 TaxID=2976982 RepID=UPI002468E442|nr:hypothetical protein [Pigmentibacter sp. JX0631]WGL60915.1 hypothetical protein QEJ31_04800 [Pigmentibacter sp. JX0631]
MTNFQSIEIKDYSILASLFIDLRGKGVSLSTADLEILHSWEKANLKPEFIMQVMFEYASECRSRAKDFPNNLAPISRRLHSILAKSAES